MELLPNGDQAVTFSIDGPATLAAVGSGDLGTTQSYQADRQQLFNGRAQAVVRSSSAKGTIRVTAKAPELPDGRVELLAR